MKLKNEAAANAKKMNVYFKGTEEIKDEMARIKPCLDEGWRKSVSGMMRLNSRSRNTTTITTMDTVTR